MKNRNKCVVFFHLCVWCVLSSCDKFLDVKPQMNIAVPETIADVRAILDNVDILNMYGPPLLIMGTDDYYVDDATLYGQHETHQGAYLWKEDYMAVDLGDWIDTYRAIMHVNVALESLDRITEGSSEERSLLYAEGLFIRAFLHYGIIQVFAPVYISGVTDGALAIPYKTSSDIQEKTVRLTLGEGLDLIDKDLSNALPLLPPMSVHPNRASQQSVYALKSRIYMANRMYNEAMDMADKALSISSDVTDLNTLDLTNIAPFPLMHKEIIYASIGSRGNYFSQSIMNIDTVLYQSYDENDLRKDAYFFEKGSRGHIGFKSNYAGVWSAFSVGLSTDELWLIRAECRIRQGQVAEGLVDLNTLLEKKWLKGAFTPFSQMSQEDALDLILTERRKQLVFRGVRWSDLRRLNQEERYQKELVRRDDSGAVIARISLAESLYCYRIPDEIIHFSGIPQND